jgi:hypothetical protein
MNDGLRRVVPAMRAVFVIGSVLVALAAIQLFVLTDHTARFFAWTITPGLSAAFLGAFYITAFVLAAVSATEIEWARARVGVAGILAFVTLTMITTFRHLDKFHFHASAFPRGAAWLWTIIYVIAPIGVAVALVFQQRAPGIDRPRTAPLPAWYRLGLVAQAVVLFVVAISFFVSSTVSWWPWTLTPLVAQAMASWLFALAIVLVTAVWEDDWRRIRIAALAYVVLAGLQLIALVRYAGVLNGGTAETLYVAFLIVAGATGVVGIVMERRERERSGGTFDVPGLDVPRR